MMSSNVLLFPGRAVDLLMTSPNFIVIGLQIGKLHRGAESALPPPAVLDSKKPSLFRVQLDDSGNCITRKTWLHCI